MSDLNPYPADPYHQGVAGTRYPTDFDGVSQSASAVSSTQNGYYSADALGDPVTPLPGSAGGQMVPYPGDGQQPYSQAYGQPYSPAVSLSAASYGRIHPYGQGVYWGRPYDPRRHEANALGGWALGLGIASIVANCLSFGLILGISAIVVGRSWNARRQ